MFIHFPILPIWWSVFSVLLDVNRFGVESRRPIIDRFEGFQKCLKDPGHFLAGKMCYQAMNDKLVQWIEGEGVCKKVGAEFAILDRVDDLMKRLFNLSGWIALRQNQFPESTPWDFGTQWLWYLSNGTKPEAKNISWSLEGQEPNQLAGDEDCAIFESNSIPGIRDYACNRSFPTICMVNGDGCDRKDVKTTNALIESSAYPGHSVNIRCKRGFQIGLHGPKSLECYQNGTWSQTEVRCEKGETFQKAAVACNNGLCSTIGARIMRKGGNAVDAAIATSICLGVVEPQSSGLGGGHFMTIYRRSNKSCTIIDARETAPSASSPTMYTDHLKKNSTRGWAAIGVPGELKGLWEAHRLMGRSNWSDLLTPSVKLAEQGFIVSAALGRALITDHLTGKETRESIMAEPSLSFLINPKSGDVYKAGEKMKLPTLAKTLRQLSGASNPSDLFYQGALADSFTQEFDQHRPEAVITKKDLNKYQVQIREAISTKLANGLIVCAAPPPSSGAVTSAIINIVGGSKLVADSSQPGADTQMYHEIIEAMKFSFAIRSILGDSTFGRGNITKAKEITSEAWAESVRRKISPTKVFSSKSYGSEFKSKSDHGTAHSAFVDADGNAVSITSTINL